MRLYEFEVKGSAPDPYHVRIERRDDVLFAHCTCAAGEKGGICKHRLAIFEGDSSGVVSPNAQLVSEIPTLVIGTNIEDAMIEMQSAERALDAAKKALSATKKKLARLMNG